MNGVFYTKKFYISIDNREWYRYKDYEIRYTKKDWINNTEEEFSITKDKLIEKVMNKELPFTIYIQWQDSSKQYLLLEEKPKFFVGGIDVDSIKKIKIKVEIKKVWCQYSVEELRTKLPAEEYIDMIKKEGI